MEQAVQKQTFLEMISDFIEDCGFTFFMMAYNID